MEAKLIGVAGPALGTEFPLRGDEAIIGRAPDIAVSIADTSVSRRHVQLTKVPDGWRVKDLGSGNGTTLNGEKLDEEMPLRNGDLLTMGDTQLSFVDLANSTDRAPPPARPPPSKASAPAESAAPAAPVRRLTGTRPEARVRVSRQQPAARRAGTGKLRRVVLFVALILVTAAAGLGYLKKKQDKKNEVNRIRQAQVQQAHDQVAEVMQNGKNLAREGEWRKAKVQFEKVAEVAPDFPELASYMKMLPKEVQVQQELDGAQTALNGGKLGEAAEHLSKATAGTTLYNPRLRRLQAQLESKLIPRIAEAKSALATNDYEHALQLVGDLLKVAPGNREAQVIAEQAQKLAQRAHPPAREPGIRVAASEPRVLEPAVQRYLEGDIAGAVALTNNCAGSSAKCRVLLKDMGEAADLSKKLDDLNPGQLRRFVALDREIGEGKPSKVGRLAGVKLSALLYKTASGARASNDWPKAKELARQVLALDPGHVGAASIIEECNRKTHDLYFFAYTNKDTNADEALKAFRQVVEMTPSDDDQHKKAQAWIDKLSR